jgi:hypothetical protein
MLSKASHRLSRYCENFVVVLFSPLIGVRALPRFCLIYIAFLSIIFLFFRDIQYNRIFVILDWISFIIAWMIYPLCILGIIHITIPWIKHIRIFGIPNWRTCLETKRLHSFVGGWGGGWLLGERHAINRPGAQKYPNESVLYDLWEFLSYALIMSFIYFWTKLDMFLGYAICSSIISFGAVFSNILPPALLFLATSDHKSFEFLAEISKAIKPLRIANLLDRDTAIKTDSGNLEISLLGDEYRTLDDNLWIDSVKRLIDLTPIIFLDARSQSIPLIEEASLILNSPHAGKTIFISHTEKERPLDELVEITDRSAELMLTCIKADKAIDKLREILKEKRSERLVKF